MKATGMQFVAILLWIIFASLSGNSEELLHPQQKISVFSCYDDRLSPTYLELEEHGTYLVWQVPRNPVGVLLISHGRSRTPLSFWDKHEHCQRCYGLPEDRAIVLHALARGYAVVAVKSQRLEWDSWPLETSGDIAVVTYVVNMWRREKSLDHLPLVGLGISSGGNFTSALAARVNFKAVVFMISSGRFEIIRNTGEFYPPTLYIHMLKDPWEAQVVQGMQMMRDNGVKVENISCYEFPVTPDLFTQRIPCFDIITAAAIFDVLKEEKFLDKGGLLVRNPRISGWEQVLRDRSIVKVCSLQKLCWQDSIAEELNLAFAAHAITSLSIPQVLAWVDALDHPSF